MEYYQIVVGVILLIVILLLATREKFDTYFKHDIAANAVLNQDIAPSEQQTVPETALSTKYNWNNRDAFGRNIYDLVYEDKVLSNTLNNKEYLPNIDKYDSRFDANKTFVYSNSDMAEPQKFDVFNGLQITLSQK